MFKPHNNVINAPVEIQEELVKIRQQRAFIPSHYLEIKARLINQYFNQNNLSHAVIGISGGIDSVTCLYLLRYAQSLPNSPIKDIVAVGFIKFLNMKTLFFRTGMKYSFNSTYFRDKYVYH